MERLKINNTFETDDNLLQSMREAYDNCPMAIKFIKDLGIPDEAVNKYITKVYSFVSDINYCKKCPGIKNCKKENPLLCTKVTYNFGIVDREMVPCKEFLKRLAFERQFMYMDFNRDWLDCTLRDVDKAKDRDKVLVKYTNFIKNGINNWIYLTGSPNSGRTFLAAVLCIDAARKEKGPVAFLNTQKRVQELYDLYYKDKERFQKVLDKLCNIPILVLDDYGNEYKNDFIRDGIIFPLIYNRANKKLFTIITSDFKSEDVKELYSTTKAATIRAKQIDEYIKSVSGEEISLGDLSVY